MSWLDCLDEQSKKKNIRLLSTLRRGTLGRAVIAYRSEIERALDEMISELIDYAKTLYEQQDEQLRRRFPLAKPLKEQSALKLEFANGSRIIGIPEGADQVRSYHPWGLLMDKAAFQPEALRIGYSAGRHRLNSSIAPAQQSSSSARCSAVVLGNEQLDDLPTDLQSIRRRPQAQKASEHLRLTASF